MTWITRLDQWRRRWIGTREQRRKWTLPSRLTFVGVLVTLALAPFAVIAYVFPFPGLSFLSDPIVIRDDQVVRRAAVSLNSAQELNALTPERAFTSPQGADGYNEAPFREYAVDLPGATFDTISAAIRMTVSGTRPGPWLLKRVYVRVSEVQRAIKYAFPGVYPGGGFSTNMGGALVYSLRLDSNTTEHTLYRAGASDTLYYYAASSAPDRVTIYFDSPAGYEYLLRTGFEVAPLDHPDHVERYESTERSVLFPRWVSVDTMLRSSRDTIHMVAELPSSIGEVISRAPERPIEAILSGSGDGIPGAAAIPGGPSVRVLIASHDSGSESWIELSPDSALVRRTWVDPDYAYLTDPEISPYRLSGLMGWGSVFRKVELLTGRREVAQLVARRRALAARATPLLDFDFRAVDLYLPDKLVSRSPVAGYGAVTPGQAVLEFAIQQARPDTTRWLSVELRSNRLGSEAWKIEPLANAEPLQSWQPQRLRVLSRGARLRLSGPNGQSARVDILDFDLPGGRVAVTVDTVRGIRVPEGRRTTGR